MRFVLVHGAHHGAWCWDKLERELVGLGHTTLAIDLPGCSERVHEAASLASWRAALNEVVQDGDVLVGHSMGGFAISLAADEVPDRVAGLVYLTAAVPIEGAPMGAASAENVVDDWAATVGVPFDEFMDVVDVPGQGPCARLTSQAAANALFYHDCSPVDQDWAWERLTPLPVSPMLEPMHLPRFWAAPIPRNYIVATDDRSHPMSMDNEFMRRLGLSTAYAVMSSHSPFISRPGDTAKLLDACAGSAQG
jgi:pimeloyl-ACP methyl ester carboxylesterase